ncbi:hypothetical protein [Sulfuricurvum sp.]|uniref:hypothetical protein n=1 Tax=Sulfuricurvum sp. TaxID=2025608 RepID=UPI0026343E68|nr:hypothetical protein [Sulfuricurvum sp.]MDD2266019.1 hypothetical protein [Sulfuricurvum sp.]MDD2783031.1 hypothetical protein [Sulfuricurvum sp.]
MKHRLFSYGLVGITLFLFAAIGAFNYVIDPYGYNHAFPLKINAKKRVQNERQDKFTLLSKYPHVESFIFGSSRALRLNPDIVTSITKDETLNMAFCSASEDEYYLYIKYLVETRKVKTLIIGIDLFAYADAYQSNDTLPASLLAYYHLENTPQMSSYLNYDTLKDSLKTVQVNIKAIPSLNEYYTPHGQNIRIEYLKAAENQTTLKSYTYKNVIEKPPFWHIQKDKLSQERLNQLKEIKKLCDQKGIRLYLFMNPLWIKQITMKQNKFFLQKALLKYIVTTVQPVWDYNAITAINTDPYAYEDQFHFSCKTGDSILSEVIGSKASIAKYSGTYVTPQNLEAYLDQVDQNLRMYLKKAH